MSKKLSSKYLIDSHINPLKTFDLPSTKGLIPTNSKEEIENTAEALIKLKNFLNFTRVDRRQNRSQAVWMPERRLSKVTKRAGKVLSNFGFTENGETFLLPEESLYLLETNYLELLWNDVPFSIEQAYCILINSKENLEKYRTFKELANYGYRIKETEITPKHSCPDESRVENKKIKYDDNETNLFEKLKQEGPKTANLAGNYNSLYNIYLPKNSIKNKQPDFEVIAKPTGSNFSYQSVSSGNSSTVTAFTGNESISFYQFHEVDIENK